MMGWWPSFRATVADRPATNLAFAPRGNADLSAMVTKDVPAIGLLASPSAKLPFPIRQPQGCGCRAQDGGAASLAALGVLGVLVLRRRRR